MGEVLVVMSILVGIVVVFGLFKKTEHKDAPVRTPSNVTRKTGERGIGPNQKVGDRSGKVGHTVTKTSGRQKEDDYHSGKTYYEILGLSSNATGNMIKEAWRKKDTGQCLSIETRRAYHLAYKTLSDPQERSKYDANPRKWSYENESSYRRKQDVLSKSVADSKSGRQTVYSSTLSSTGSNLSNQGKAGKDRVGAYKPNLGRSGKYSRIPHRKYYTDSSPSFCQACRWRYYTIRSGRAWSIKGVNHWASVNCTCRR